MQFECKPWGREKAPTLFKLFETITWWAENVLEQVSHGGDGRTEDDKIRTGSEKDEQGKVYAVWILIDCENEVSGLG